MNLKQMNLRQKGIEFWNWLFRNSLYITGFSSLGLNIIDISNINEKTLKTDGGFEYYYGDVIYWSLVIIALFFGVFSISNAKEVDVLEEENSSKGNEINLLESSINEVVNANNELFNSYLRLLLSNLNFEHTERISVYKTYENNFLLIGRNSTNPLLTRIGRQSYPIDEGFIGKGWAEGEFFIDNLPDSTINRGNDYYTAINIVFPIPRRIVNNIKMKSRTYYIYRMYGYNNTPNSVLVLESINANAFSLQFVKEKLDDIKQPLEMFIEKNISMQINRNTILAENLGL